MKDIINALAAAGATLIAAGYIAENVPEFFAGCAFWFISFIGANLYNANTRKRGVKNDY